MGYLIHTQIDINAPAPVVWDILVDLGSYRDWNPFVVSARGNIAAGEVLHVQPRDSRRKTYSFRPVVKLCTEGRAFSWVGHVLHPQIAAGEHIFELESLGDRQCRLIHDEVLSGLALPLMVLLTRHKIVRGFEEMNRALKRRAEAAAATD